MIVNLKMKLLGAVVASGIGTKALSVKRSDVYRHSVVIHHEMSKATKMDWGNPLPFESEILTRWGSRKRSP